MTPQERLIATAVDQTGYIGKRSNAQLDTPAANGGGKFNKYARDLDALSGFYNGPKQGFDWCDVFVDWCFVETFGRDLAQKLLCQPDRSCGAGTAYSLGYYKNHGRLFSAPEAGDQIFFGDRDHTWHTGIVTRVSGGNVCTVEGNAGNPVGVHQFRYPADSRSIKGYGRPDWSLVSGGTTASGGTAPGGGTTAGGTASALRVGDVVDFTGTRHYASSDAVKASACRPGKAKVTALAKGARHPCHLVGVSAGGSTVYGWVDAGDIGLGA